MQRERNERIGVLIPSLKARVRTVPSNVQVRRNPTTQLIEGLRRHGPTMRRMAHCLPPLSALALFLLIWSYDDAHNHQVHPRPQQPPPAGTLPLPPPPPLIPKPRPAQTAVATSVAANPTPAGPVEQCTGSDCVCDPISGGGGRRFRIARFHTSQVQGLKDS